MVKTTNNVTQALLLLVILVVSLLSSFPIYSKSFNESEIKIAYIYKIAKYVEWPQLQNSDPDHLNICLLGDSRPLKPFYLLAEKSIGKRLIRLTNLNEVSIKQDINKQCEIVYVATKDLTQWHKWKHKQELNKSLVIGFDLSLKGQGGIILFQTEDQRVKFYVDIKQARKKGFNFRAQLLEVAEIIK